jgi:hypothetical protein
MIDLLQNKELVTKAPSKISEKLDSSGGNGTTKVEVEETSDHHEDILTAGLILAATFLLSQVLPSSSLRILGVAFLVAATVLFSKRI